ncbi:hypothetical protein CY34DRAFT_800081 [Suillus luteus UH-Slu-Lm8-n1]|uniref:Uncharacterized protein n=1 Tax=Suillus luteus UH-Slu-Lm8-n1 TaxID=930992 RepID=A0A0D0BL85_9AGAM|nr:hypothetical protein CY34DRAFT_800081 [Suillus luteus UH-Slu-Lm8-n1]
MYGTYIIGVFLLALSYADTDTDSYSLPVDPSDSVLRGCAVDCMLQVNINFSCPSVYTSFPLDFLVENSTSTFMRKRTADVYSS